MFIVCIVYKIVIKVNRVPLVLADDRRNKHTVLVGSGENRETSQHHNFC